MPATHSKKEEHVYHCETSQFLTKVSVSIWELSTHIVEVLRVKCFSHSYLIYDFRCSTVRGLCCRILFFIMHHTLSVGDRSGLQAGQSDAWTLSRWSHAVLTPAGCVLSSSRWNKQGRLWKRRLDGSICCSKNLYVPLRNMLNFYLKYFHHINTEYL